MAAGGSDIAREYPAAIVGAGPAGLAAARALRLRGVPYIQFERHARLGGIWDIDNPGSPMYESAHFISSRDRSGFWDEPMPSSFADYPSREQILGYTRAFARGYGLTSAIRFDTTVEHAEQNADGVWTIETSGGPVRAGALIAANGTTWHARRPELPGEDGFLGTVIHSQDYRGTDRFRGRSVLVVGLGNSGADIACDAAVAARRAFVSTRRGYHFIPKHILGEPSDTTDWLPIWGERLLYAITKPLVIGDVRRWGLPKPDHRLFETHPLLNTQLLHHLQHGDVTAKPGVERLDGRDVVFADGTREQVDLVVLATGYDFAVPYLPDGYLHYTGGRPDLYLNGFSPTRPGLYATSFIEVNSSAYTLFDQLANLIAQRIADGRSDDAAARARVARFDRLAATDRPDLSGGIRFVQSDRHANYVEVRAFRRAVGRLARRIGWQPLTPGMYEPVKAAAAAAAV